MAFLNRGQIIAEGLQIGNNPHIQARARVFLKMFELWLYRTQDFEFLEKEQTGLVLAQGASTIDLSTTTPDFGHLISLRMEDADTAIKAVPRSRLWAQLQAYKEQGQTGTPRQVAYDANSKQLVFDVPSSKTVTFDLLYLHVPTIPDPTDEVTFDASDVPLEDAYIYVNVIAEFAKYWDKDTMFNIARAVRQETVQAIKGAELQNRANAVQFELDPNVHRTWRR